jgi:spermidine dehydrogenase
MSPFQRKATSGEDTITRRDYLNSALVASGSMLLGAASPIQLLAREDWNGYGGVGDYSSSNGNTWEVMTDGHKIRDHIFEPLPTDITETKETFDCVVVGGGISGLSAGLFYSRKTGGKKGCLILENHAIFGGEARRNEFVVGGERVMAHQGSAMYFPCLPGTFLSDFYRSIYIRNEDFQYQEWTGKNPEIPVGLTPYFGGGPASAFFFGPKFQQPAGMFLKDPWSRNLEGAPISATMREQWLRTRQPAAAEVPVAKKHGDEGSRYMDRITLEEYLMRAHGISRETVRTFLSPVAGGGSGLGADALSAYAEFAADVLLPWDYDKKAQMFPGGNAGVARHIVKAMLPDALPGEASMAGIAAAKVNSQALDRKGQPIRIRLQSTVISVQHEGAPEHAEAVRVVYLRNGRLYAVRARSVVVAGGSWTAKHIVKDLPREHEAAYALFHRAPCLMANIALKNWRFLYNLGISEFQWFEGIGNYTAIRRLAKLDGITPGISPDSPVVLTLKILFSSPGLSLEQQVIKGRTELYSTPFRVYEKKLRDQLAMMFGSHGFNAGRDIAAIILNRWGHAYLAPQPGFFFGNEQHPAPGDFLRSHPYGRVAFANSDLAGIMDHRMSIIEADRATDQVIELA